eukprot:8373966-Alexandrium_andersonii.AAC.1
MSPSAALHHLRLPQAEGTGFAQSETADTVVCVSRPTCVAVYYVVVLLALVDAHESTIYVRVSVGYPGQRIVRCGHRHGQTRAFGARLDGAHESA